MRRLFPFSSHEDLEAVRQQVAREWTAEDMRRQRKDAREALLGAALTAVDLFIGSAPDLAGRIDATARQQLAVGLVDAALALARR